MQDIAWDGRIQLTATKISPVADLIKQGIFSGTSSPSYLFLLKKKEEI